MPNGLGVVEVAAYRVADRMTPDIQNLALEYGWPVDVARRLSLTQSEGILYAQYNGPAKEMEDLEYGTPGSPPKAAINSFFGSHRIKKEIQKNTTQSMDEIVDTIQGFFS